MNKVRFYISIFFISIFLLHSQKLSAGTLRVIPYTVITETETPVTLLNFSPDGSKLFGVSDKTVIIWDAGTLEESNQINEDAAIRVLKFSPDSDSILSVLDDNSVVVRDYDDLWELVRIRSDTDNSVLDADFLSDRYTLAAPLNGTTLSSCFVLIITEEIMPSRLADFDSTVCSVEADSTGNRLLITLSDGSVHFVNAAAKTAETVLEGSSDFRLGASFVPGDETFLCLADGNVIIARTVSGTELFRIDLPEVPAGRITYSPDGKAFAVRTESGGMVNLFDCQTGMPLLSVQAPESSKAQCTILDAVFSPDGNYLYTSLDDGRLIRWTLNTLFVAEMGEGPFSWEQREGEEWAYQLPYVPKEAKTDNDPSSVLVLGAGYSLVQQSYYTGSIDIDTWFHKRIGTSDFMWGVEAQLGVSKPTDDYPYKYIFSDNTPLLTPRLYTIQTLASLSYNLSSDSNTRVFFGVVAGPVFRFLWNNNMKRSVQTKLYPSLDIGVDGGLDYKGLTVTVAYIYNTQIGLQPSFQLGYALRFGSGGEKNEE